MLVNVVSMAKILVEKVVQPGDKVIDATAGNGKDTLFLAGLVGDTGTVYSFDIQQKALDNTSRLLKEQGVLNRVRLIKDGHQHLDLYVKSPVKAVMFNLGYLPGGDHSVITLPDTTLTALEKSLYLLLPGGIITIVVYCGHPGGREEKDLLLERIKGLDSSGYKCVLIESVNQRNNPPALIAIEKRLTVS